MQLWLNEITALRKSYGIKHNTDKGIYLLYYHQDKKRDYSVTSEMVFYELVIGFLSNKPRHQNTNLPLLQHSERNSCRKVLLSHR